MRWKEDRRFYMFNYKFELSGDRPNHSVFLSYLPYFRSIMAGIQITLFSGIIGFLILFSQFDVC